MTRQVANIGLALGVLLGAAIAAYGVLQGPDYDRSIVSAEDLPEDVMALVYQNTITTEDYQRALAAFESDRRESAGPQERRHVIERLVDEELLVQRGIELQLPARDPRTRADLSAAVITLITEQAEASAAPSPEDLAKFYEDHQIRFTTPARYELTHVFFAVTSERSDAAAHTLATGAREQLVEGQPVVSDELAAPPPQGPLPAQTISDYLGPSVATSAAQLEIGEVSRPIRSFGGYHLFRLDDRIGGELQSFEDVEDLVREAYLRWVGDDALKRFLEGRRQQLDVVIAWDRL